MTRVRVRTQPPAAPAAPPEQPRSAVQRNARTPAPTPPAPGPRQRLRTRADAAAPVTLPNPAATGATGTVVVERERTSQGVSITEQASIEHPIRRLPDGTFTPAYVRVGGGATVQPRQYESVRISVEVTLPCYPDAAGLEGAYAEAVAFVTSKVDDQLSQI